MVMQGEIEELQRNKKVWNGTEEWIQRPMQVLALHRSQDSFSTGFGGRGRQRMWVLMQIQRRTCRWEDEVVLILQKSIFSMKYTARSSAENGTGEGVLET